MHAGCSRLSMEITDLQIRKIGSRAGLAVKEAEHAPEEGIPGDHIFRDG
jgi:hypothetical protein